MVRTPWFRFLLLVVAFDFSTYGFTTVTPTTQSESVFVRSAYFFTSPNYPSNYSNNLRYTWYFFTTSGIQLDLTFTAIDTEANSDHITVRNSSEFFSGELLLQWSGTGPQNEVKVRSSGNVMSVTFETDGSVTRTGFAVLLQATSLTRDELDCGENFNCQNGVCLPQERVCDDQRECGNGADENNENCTDIRMVTCSFSEFSCNDGFCIPQSWRCDGIEDCMHNEDEYNCYNSTDTPTAGFSYLTPTTQSESVFVSSAYFFTSPNYPLDYPNSLRYTWYFSTNPGLQLSLTFTEIDTEENFDFINVREGNESFSGELLLQWSGSGLANDVKVLSSGNVMSVTFETDGSVTRTGFAVILQATSMTSDELDCGENFNCQNGVCLPQKRVCDDQRECGNGADENNGNCTVTCSFSEFSCKDGFCIPQSWRCDGSQDCMYNEDEYDCYYYTTLTPITESESIFVSFASRYFFTSPNYPSDYPNNLRYTWYLSTNPWLKLSLTFTEIDTEENFDFINVREGNESFSEEMLLQWSGSGPANDVKVLSSGNVLSVTFETDGSVTRTGFAVFLQATTLTKDELDCAKEFNCQNGVCIPQERVCDNEQECGNNADENNETCTVTCSFSEFSCYNGFCIPQSRRCDGIQDCRYNEDEQDCDYSENIFVVSSHFFTSPNYPSDYPNSLQYTWYFSTYPGLKLLLSFIDINTEYSYDYITVNDGNASFSGELLLRLSGEVSPNKVRIISSESDISVTFETDTVVATDGFAALVVVTCLERDELNCEEDFNCRNGVCLSEDRTCNREKECGNNADESSDYCPVDYITDEFTTGFPLTTLENTLQGLRLAGGNSSAGRVEVLYNGEWGTVCDDSWDINDARVVCLELGFSNAIASYRNAFFGAGSGQIWMDDVQCNGQESSLSDCMHNGFGIHNCAHIKDAGVACRANTAPSIPVCPVVPSVTSITRNIGNFVSWNIGNCSDAEDGSIIPTCDPPSGSFFRVGFNAVVCNCTDSGSLSTECTFNAVVVRDNTAPSTPICPMVSPVTSFGTSNIGNVVSWSIGNCFDAEDGSITPTCIPRSGSFFFVGSNPVVCTCTDSRSMSTECTFDAVVVGSNTAPTIPICPNVPSVTSLIGNIGNIVSWNIGNCFDAEDDSITPTCEPRSGSLFSVGSNPVVCTCTDSGSLSTACTFNAVVVREMLSTVSCLNGVRTPQFSTACFCNPGFGGDICNTTTTLSGPLNCPSNGAATFATPVTYPEPSGLPAGFQLLFRTFQSGTNDLPLGENELLLVYGDGVQTLICEVTITVT